MPKYYYMPARIKIDTSTYSGRFAARLREKAGLSVEELAEAVKVTATTCYRWESGENFPKADLLPAIAKVLKNQGSDADARSLEKEFSAKIYASCK